MDVAKVGGDEAIQSRSLGIVAYACSKCERREGAYATLHWRVRKLLGIPLTAGVALATYRCVACDGVTEDSPPTGVGPPFVHRFGALIVFAIAGVLSISAIVVAIALPASTPRASEAMRAEVDALRTRVNDATRFAATADDACKQIVDAALKRALPDVWKAAAVAPSEPVIADDLPVVVEEHAEIAPEFMPKRACKHQIPKAPFVFVAAGGDEARSLAELTAQVVAYEAEIAALGPPPRFVYLAAECLAARCGARAALVSRDGTLLALAAVKPPPQLQQEATESRFRRALGAAIRDWANRRP